MPGSNHDVDASFMDTLPISVRDAGLELIRFSGLKDLLEMRLNGPNEFMRTNFDLDENQWVEVLDAVILTKISYFTIELNFPNRYIDKLIEIACFAYGFKSEDPVTLYQSTLPDHPQFASWIKNAIQIKQQNLHLEQNRPANSA